MANLFFSMAGEGRGHAARAKAVVDGLKERHRITLLTPDDAWDFLAPIYRDDPAVRVERIPGPRFVYTGAGRVSATGTAWANAGYTLKLPRLIRQLQRKIEAERPDLVISDFEPALPRAARRAGVPHVHFNHQDFLLVFDLSDLPPWLRRRARVMSLGVRLYEAGPRALIVSSFFEAPLKPHRRDVTVHPVGVMIRPSLKAAAPSAEGHVLAYLRKHPYPAVLDGLARSGRPVRVYGLGERPARGNVEFRAVDAEAFTRDLLTCDALVCNAGNQLLGEASYLRKPIFALPEAMQHEQWINAHYLAKGGGGIWADPGKVTPEQVLAFLEDPSQYRCTWDPDRIDGTATAIAALEGYLPRAARGGGSATDQAPSSRPTTTHPETHKRSHSHDPERTAL